MAVKKNARLHTFVPNCFKIEETATMKKIFKEEKKERSIPRLSLTDFSSSTISTEDLSISLAGTNLHVFTLQELKVLDASWYMPNEKRNPLQEYQVAHIPGALFFDIDGIVDQTTDLPHMLPSEKAFAAAISALGIENNDQVVVYDGKGIFSSARVWWMFRVFGHERVWVLDGGLMQEEELREAEPVRWWATLVVLNVVRSPVQICRIYFMYNRLSIGM